MKKIVLVITIVILSLPRQVHARESVIKTSTATITTTTESFYEAGATPVVAVTTESNWLQKIARLFRDDNTTLSITNPAQEVITTTTLTSSTTLSLNNQTLIPGRYTITIDNEPILDFRYGVLALNPDQDRYQLGAIANIALAALDDRGHTRCNANLRVEFSGIPYPVKSQDTCGADNVTDNPDYTATIPLNIVGTHELKLIDQDSGLTFSQNLVVENDPPIEIKRSGATRINPFASTYTMHLTITSEIDWQGLVQETLPTSFITNDSLSWNITLQAGIPLSLSYIYQAPRVSPKLYELGPLIVGNYTESRTWVLASDAISYGSGMVVYGDGSQDVIKYRVLNPAGSWVGAAANTADIDAGTTNRRPYVMHVYANHRRDEMMLLSSHYNGTTMYMYGQVYNGVAGTWGNVQLLDSWTLTLSEQNHYIDGTYLANGDFMAVHSNDTDIPQFSIWNGTSWSTVSAPMVTIDSGAKPHTIIARARPGTNEVMIVVSDNNRDTNTIYYDGSGTATSDFTRHTEHADTNVQSSNIDLDFVWSTHDKTRGMLVFTDSSSDTTPNVNVWTANGSGGGSWGTANQSASVGNAIKTARLTTDPNSHEFTFCVVDNETTNDIECLKESDGDTTPTTQTTTNGELTNSTDTTFRAIPVDVAYEQSTGTTAIAVYSDNTSVPKLKKYNQSTSTWDSSAINLSDQTETIRMIEIYPKPMSDDIAIITRDSGIDVHFVVWDGTNDTLYSSGDRATQQLSNASGVTTIDKSFGFAWSLYSVPNTPTLNSPLDTASNQSVSTILKTTASDNDGDYLQYKIELCTNVDMSAGCQTFDQTSSQTGWSNQNAASNTAYTSGSKANYTIQSPLSHNTTYYWRSYALDPAGTNTWSSTQGTPYSFTTIPLTADQTMSIEGLNLEGININ